MIKYRDKSTGEELIWWELREIRFTQKQVKFLLNHLPQLRVGKYPTRPEGYSNFEIMTRAAGNAGFTKPCELAGELESRLQQCAIDGLITEAYYCNELPIIRIMWYCGQTETEVWNRIGRCIRYCSGWKRKRLSYRDYVNHKW